MKTPNPLPGNPHHYDANTDAPPGQYQVAQATLALAFETRTATLVALLDSGALGADYTQVAGQINPRLGLGGDDE